MNDAITNDLLDLAHVAADIKDFDLETLAAVALGFEPADRHPYTRAEAIEECLELLGY